MANLLTGLRFVLSMVLLFCPALSSSFYVCYLAAGITDMLDGPVARKTGTAGPFGSRLDTAADFVFVIVCLVRLLPVLDLAAWMYVWTGVIAVIKIGNLISGYVVQKKFPAVHTALNKAAGLILFLVPLTLPVMDLKYSALAAGAAATLAAIQEGHIIRKG